MSFVDGQLDGPPNARSDKRQRHLELQHPAPSVHPSRHLRLCPRPQPHFPIDQPGPGGHRLRYIRAMDPVSIEEQARDGTRRPLSRFSAHVCYTARGKRRDSPRKESLPLDFDWRCLRTHNSVADSRIHIGGLARQ